MEKEWKKLISAHSKYDSAICGMEQAIVEKVEFDDFSIFWQPSDGFVIEYEANNAPLDKCLLVIKEKGTLSLEDYLELTI